MRIGNQEEKDLDQARQENGLESDRANGRRHARMNALRSGEIIGELNY